MDGGVAGTGSVNLQDSLPRPGVAPGSKGTTLSHAAVAGLVQDEIASSLLNLANSHIGQLLEQMDEARLTLDPALLDSLLQRAETAARSNDIAAALSAVTELIRMNPERGAQLVRESLSLRLIQGEVNDLLQRLELGAKAEAERTLAAASAAVEAGKGTSAEASLYPQLLAVAQQFIETGQHMNFVRAAELGQAILASIPAGTGKKASAQAPAGARERRRRRSPMLVALGWVSLALIAFAAFQFWLARP